LKETCESTRLQPSRFPRNDQEAGSLLPMRPFVSIILCTNGLRPMLARCLEHLSAQAQNYPDYEIIVVFNGPEDPAFTQAVSQFPVKLLHEPRRGVSNARNHAVPQAKGDILVFVDDDVVTDSNWLEEIVKCFADPNVACVTGRVIPAGMISLATERAVRYYASERALSPWSLDASNPNWYQHILGEPVGFGCNMAFRKTFLEDYSLFPPDLGAGSLIGGGDEFYMYVQVIKHGFRIRHAPAAAVTHFFEDDIEKQRVRNAQLYAGSVAFALKMFLEERTLRLAIAKWLFSALKRRARRVWNKKAISSEPQELLSPGEKVCAYLRGLAVFWKSHRLKNPATPHS
jgi:cellulose synthase/poly-beta-1,6-N-acetylglucosamine synthase-like glycosyltransferase